jgi:hypothetical protein
MHGSGRSLRPWQRSFSLALANGNHDEQGECGNRRRNDSRRR